MVHISCEQSYLLVITTDGGDFKSKLLFVV